MEGLPNGSTTTVEYCASSPTALRYRLPQQHHQQYHHHRLPAIRGSDPDMQQVSYRDDNYPQHPYPGVSSSMITPSTTAVPPIDPALATAGGRAPPTLRPMPVRGYMPQPAINSPYDQGPLMPWASMMPDSDPPTRVVRSEGRRAILPSAPGRPAAPAAGSAEAKNQIHQKDADGKFPCVHCAKTYLHAKHLKRHLLRHTGERPYMCVLCHDTFARSDILKRHFIKCSVRRGNPTGASHLSHPQAHVKKNAAARQNPAGAEGVNDVQWIASPSCQSKHDDLYPGWTAFDSNSVSGHSGARSVGPL